MELMNCKNCKRLFNYIAGDPICPKCKELLEDKFQEVKKYIRENPGSNVDEVAEAGEEMLAADTTDAAADIETVVADAE